MSDVNRWHRQVERRALLALHGEIMVLAAATATERDKHDHGQRRMAKRIIDLIEAKLVALRELDERAESQSADDIDEGLKA